MAVGGAEGLFAKDGAQPRRGARRGYDQRMRSCGPILADNRRAATSRGKGLLKHARVLTNDVRLGAGEAAGADYLAVTRRRFTSELPALFITSLRLPSPGSIGAMLGLSLCWPRPASRATMTSGLG